MYETRFVDGTLITISKAVSYIRGEEKPEKEADIVRAWSYVCGTRIYFSLGGDVMNAVKDMINDGGLSQDGTVDWDLVTERRLLLRN